MLQAVDALRRGVERLFGARPLEDGGGDWLSGAALLHGLRGVDWLHAATGLRVQWPVRLIRFSRAVTIGVAYLLVADIPGLTSSFVAILAALLMFDLAVALERRGLETYFTYLGAAHRLIWPRALGTAVVLVKGVIVGLVFGVLAYLGFPWILAAVLTAGLAYTLAESTPGNTSEYVGLIGGLAVFDAVIKMGLGPRNELFFENLGPVVAEAAISTFEALGLGLVAGLLVGLLTRAFLPRGYRSRRSAAYSLPPELVHVGGPDVALDPGQATAHAIVEKDSAVEKKSIAQTGLFEEFGARVLAIQRGARRIPFPGGKEKLLRGDSVLLLLPAGQAEKVMRRFSRTRAEHDEQTKEDEARGARAGNAVQCDE